MVFHQEAQFQQFVHCKFRENIVRLLYIPTLENGNVFLVVNKFGKVGFYHPEKFTLIHTYVLDLSVPMHPNMTKNLLLKAKQNKNTPPPNCQRSHLVIDACFAQDVKSVIFITSKSILQWYDVGEIETQSIGLELFPRKEFLTLKKGESPVPLKNKGHVETHRVFGLREAPTCMEYYSTVPSKVGESDCPDNKMSKLLIGDAEGCVTVILIENPRKPLGFRKIRGILHEIKAMDLVNRGQLMVYKAHNDAVNEIRFIRQRQLIISCSRDKKFSLFLKDFTETVDPYIISLPKGINCFAHSENMKMIATGSDDHIVRLFNQFVIKMPQMELMGHRSSIVAIIFLSVPFSENSLLLSLSKDVELRAWNPVDYVCLQSIYISFPIKSTIMCKTPEFAKRCLYVFQPHYNKKVKINEKKESPGPSVSNTNAKNIEKETDEKIVVLYCNSFAELIIEKNTSHWPFDFEDFITEFQEVTSTFEKKIQQRQQSVSKNPKLVTLTDEQIEQIESSLLDSTVKDVLKIKRNVDKQLGLGAVSGNSGLSIQITNKLNSMKVRSEDESLSNEEFAKRGVIFRSFPIFEIPKIQFITKTVNESGLPVTDLMKEAGIHHVNSVDDILTKKAIKCFSEENLQMKQTEDAFFADEENLDSNHHEPGTDFLSQEESEDYDNDNDEIVSGAANDFSESKYEEYLETSLQKLSKFQCASNFQYLEDDQF